MTRNLQSVGLLNIRGLNSQNHIPEALADHMNEFELQMLGLIETKVHFHNDIKTITHRMGYKIHMSDQPHPPAGSYPKTKIPVFHPLSQEA